LTGKSWYYKKPYGFECRIGNFILKLLCVVDLTVAAFTGREIVLNEFSVA